MTPAIESTAAMSHALANPSKTGYSLNSRRRSLRYCEKPIINTSVRPNSQMLCMLGSVICGTLNRASPISAITGAMTTGLKNRLR